MVALLSLAFTHLTYSRSTGYSSSCAVHLSILCRPHQVLKTKIAMKTITEFKFGKNSGPEHMVEAPGTAPGSRINLKRYQQVTNLFIIILVCLS